MFGVRKNHEFLESKRIGLPVSKGAGPYLTGTTYTGDWQSNRKEGYGALTKASEAVVRAILYRFSPRPSDGV